MGMGSRDEAGDGDGDGGGNGDAGRPEDSRCTQEGPSDIQEEPKKSQETPLKTRAASKEAQVAPTSHPRGAKK